MADSGGRRLIGAVGALRRSTALFELMAKTGELLLVSALMSVGLIGISVKTVPSLLVLHGDVCLLQLIDLASNKLHLVQLAGHCRIY